MDHKQNIAYIVTGEKSKYQIVYSVHPYLNGITIGTSFKFSNKFMDKQIEKNEFSLTKDFDAAIKFVKLSKPDTIDAIGAI